MILWTGVSQRLVQKGPPRKRQTTIRQHQFYHTGHYTDQEIDTDKGNQFESDR